MDILLRPERHGLVALWNVPQSEDELLRALASLHPDERAWAETLQPVRRRDYLGGRIALRAALAAAGLADEAPILHDDRGAPRVPARALASLSHKSGWAAAVAAQRQRDRSLGLDLEHAAPSRIDISARVCTQRELAELADLPERERGLAVTLRFSAKEAVYKALDPWLRRYIGFREVEVELAADGSGRALAISPRLRSELGHAVIELAWAQIGEHWLCTAAAER